MRNLIIAMLLLTCNCYLSAAHTDKKAPGPKLHSFEPASYFANLCKLSTEDFCRNVKRDLKSNNIQTTELIHYLENLLKDNKLKFISYYRRFYNIEEAEYIKGTALYYMAKKNKNHGKSNLDASELILYDTTKDTRWHGMLLAGPIYLPLAVLLGRCAGLYIANARDSYIEPAVLVCALLLFTLMVDCFERCMQGPKEGFSLEDARKIYKAFVLEQGERTM